MVIGGGGGIYMPLWGSASFSLWPLKGVHLCVEFKMDLFYEHSIYRIYQYITVAEPSANFGNASAYLRRRFGEPSGMHPRTSGMLRRQ